jgi:hypothetical protein
VYNPSGKQSLVLVNNNSNNLSVHAKEDLISIKIISQQDRGVDVLKNSSHHHQTSYKGGSS